MIVHYHSLIDKADVLPHLWGALRSDDPPPWLWGNTGPLSLTEFIVYFSDPHRQLFLVCTPDGTDFVGLCWIDEIVFGQRARVHFYFLKKYRRTKIARIKQTCKELLRIVANPPFNLQVLLLFTDARATDAHRTAEKFGAVYLEGTLPLYYPDDALIRVGYLPLKGTEYGVTLRPTTDGQHRNHGHGDARVPSAPLPQSAT